MKIIVCLKQVPKNDSILRINEQGTWIQDRDLTYEINESDAYGLEAALQLKEKHGGEVIVLSLGPARVQSVIKEALARGADRGIHLEHSCFKIISQSLVSMQLEGVPLDVAEKLERGNMINKEVNGMEERFLGWIRPLIGDELTMKFKSTILKHAEDATSNNLDAFGVATIIAAAAKAEGFDLLLTGLQSDDFGFAQTGVIAAELLGLPHATIVMDVQSENGTIKVKRELENGFFQWVSFPAPAVLTIQSGINTLRYATLKGIMAAKKKEIKKLDATALGIDTAAIAPKQQIRRIYLPVKNKQTQFLEGSPAEVAARLMDKLKNEARVF